MNSRLALSAAFVAAVVSIAKADDSAVRVDGLAAVVGSSAPGSDSAIILNSDVELLARISISGLASDSSAPAQLPATLLKAVLNEIIGEHLIEREAERVQVGATGPADLVRERRRLETAAGGADRLQTLLRARSVSPSEVDKIIRRRARVTVFLSANLEGATVVTDSEVERAYAQVKDNFQGQASESVKEILRVRLARSVLDRSIARWVAVLRARTPVHVYAHYAL